VLARLIKTVFSAGPARAAANGNIYVCLAGGLGNQLFQYAFARYLCAQGVGVDGLVSNPFDRDVYSRRLLIDGLSRIPVVRLSERELAGLQVLANDNGDAICDALLRERQTRLVCQGYWQHARYADAVKAELANDLQSYGARHHSMDAAGECIVHVRRHDYGHLGLLPLAYYRAALEYCGWPRFRVVTDEPNFCEFVFARFQGYSGVVRGDALAPWRDFFLLANHRIQIIANSSFSWWSAWLGRATQSTSTVIAPSAWSLLKNMDPCPADWHRIDTLLAPP
jgi:hypothetical protein